VARRRRRKIGMVESRRGQTISAAAAAHMALR
jgi:hypothetical protein